MSALYGQKQFPSQNSVRPQFNQKKDFRKAKLESYCDHCKRRGHTIHQCFKLIGYPDWFPNCKMRGQTDST